MEPEAFFDRDTNLINQAKTNRAKYLRQLFSPHTTCATKPGLPEPRETPMRSHHVIAVVALLIIGFGVKVYFASPEAKAEIPSTTMDIFQMQLDNKSLPEQRVEADLI